MGKCNLLSTENVFVYEPECCDLVSYYQLL